jgi:hypothetical protein
MLEQFFENYINDPRRPIQHDSNQYGSTHQPRGLAIGKETKRNEIEKNARWFILVFIIDDDNNNSARTKLSDATKLGCSSIIW